MPNIIVLIKRIQQELTQLIKVQRHDSTNTGDDNSSFNFIWCNVRNFFKFLGLNHNLRTCPRKTREASVISSKPNSRRPRPDEDNDVETTYGEKKNLR